MRVLAAQSPRRRVEGSRRLTLIVEGAQVLLLPIVMDTSRPSAAALAPAHTHKLRRPVLLRRCHCCCPVRCRPQRTSLFSPLHLLSGGEVQAMPGASMSLPVRSPSTVCVIASQPPCCRVDGPCCLLLIVEVAQTLIVPAVPAAVDDSHPLAAPLVPSHAHEFRRVRTTALPSLQRRLMDLVFNSVHASHSLIAVRLVRL